MINYLKFRRKQIILIIYVLFLSIFFIVFVPPFQKPDEVVHFFNAASINSNLNFSSGESYIPQKLFSLPNRVMAGHIMFSYETKYPWKLTFYKDKSIDKVAYNSFLSIGLLIAYLPAAIGINIGLLFEYPLLSLYFGRFFSLLFFLICVFLSIKNIPKKSINLIYAYLLIPMLLYQASAVSYDTVSLGLGLLLLSLFVKNANKTIFSTRDFVTLLFINVLFQIVKPGYYFFSFLPIVVLINRWKNLDNKWKYILLYIISLIFMIFVFGLTLNNSKNIVVGDADVMMQLKLVSEDPIYFLNVIVNTLRLENIENLVKGLIGYFGWLDYGLNFIVYIVWFGIFLTIIQPYFLKNDLQKVNWLTIFVLGAIIAGGIFFIILSFYFSWTPVGGKIIEGVQGRYFLVFIPFLIYWFKLFSSKVGKINFKLGLIGLGLFFVIYQIISSTFFRYYDYSKLFSNGLSVEDQVNSLNINKLTKTEIVNNEFILNKYKEKKFGGIQLYTQSNIDDKNRTSVYKYIIYDGDCNKNKILIRGYFNSKVNNKPFREVFNKILSTENDFVCINLKRVTPEDGYTKSYVVKSDKGLLIEPLYIVQ